MVEPQPRVTTGGSVGAVLVVRRSLAACVWGRIPFDMALGDDGRTLVPNARERTVAFIDAAEAELHEGRVH